ncbi:MAG: diguanylate cyclase [Gammaproteobacteria bacterium]|nr:diguanylate cyclase [Gammaproteobacteria bacterium]
MDTKPVILIVDDVPANIQVLAACLRDKYRIKVATDGLRCLELVHNESEIDLILLDIEMPGMDGYEVCQQLKDDSATQDLPVIFVTVNDQEEDEERGLQLGAVDYITKPIRPSIVAARVNTHITLKQQRDRLAAMATHDQLTGLYNRHFLMVSAIKKISRSKRQHCPLSLIMMDIDRFKSINDQYGHPAGDAVLQAVSALIVKQCRGEDIVTRFGGEEFVILLDNCELQAAQYKAETFRQLIEQLHPLQIPVTCSFGVTQIQTPAESIDEVIKRADQALYQAKEAGRNRVIMTESESIKSP